MPKKGKIGDEDYDIVVAEDLKAITDKIEAGFASVRESLKTGGKERGRTTLSLGDDTCPDCGAKVGDIYQHLKSEPEKHGLVKVVEKAVEPSKKTLREHLKEHDILGCPECTKHLEEYLAAKGRKIVEAEKEEEEEDLF
jgi:uncharacterized protein (UPF0212 family)